MEINIQWTEETQRFITRAEIQRIEQCVRDGDNSGQVGNWSWRVVTRDHLEATIAIENAAPSN